MTVIQTQHLTIGYSATRNENTTIASDLNLNLQAGELVCLLGPNGAGKSTLMRTLAGMQAPLAGDVLLMGDKLHTLSAKQVAQRLSIVLTERPDLGMLSGYALVALGRYPYTGWSGRLSAKDHETVQWAIEAVGAGDIAGQSISKLSDGQRQKLMIARALAQEPAIILLDEPTAFLDLPRRVEVMQLLRQLAHDTEKSVLLSTHDLDLALRTADRIWLMTADGNLQAGAPEDLILSGAFESVFQGNGVQFDRGSGAFKIQHAVRGVIGVAGTGLHADWTRRALEREGFKTTLNGKPSSGQVMIIEENDAVYWCFDNGIQSQAYTSIYDLIRALNRSVVKQMGMVKAEL